MKLSPLLEVQNLSYSFGDRPVVRNLSLRVFPGAVIAILGASGSGKSTLLRLLAGLLPTPQDTLTWNLKPTAEASSKFGFVFQDAQLLNWRTALENVMLPLELQSTRSSRSEHIAAAQAALAQVNLTDAESLFPHQLSGGMKMRVSIARALASNPKVLFMDEPFSALDEVARFKLQEELRTLAEKKGLTVFFVTHSSYEAAFLADRVVHVEGGSIPSDHAVHYSQPRSDSLRTSSEYQAEVQKLFARMQKGVE